MNQLVKMIQPLPRLGRLHHPPPVTNLHPPLPPMPSPWVRQVTITCHWLNVYSHGLMEGVKICILIFSQFAVAHHLTLCALTG